MGYSLFTAWGGVMKNIARGADPHPPMGRPIFSRPNLLEAQLCHDPPPLHKHFATFSLK